MLQKFIRFSSFALFFLGLLLSGGCRKKVLESRSIPAPTPVNSRGVVLRTGFVPTSLVLRSVHDLATAELAKQPNIFLFRQIRVVFYSQTSSGEPDVVKYAFDLDVQYLHGVFSGRDLQTDNGDATCTLKPLNVAPADYKVLLFAKVTDEVKERTAVGSPFSALQKPMPVLYDKGPGAVLERYKNFFYSNKELVSITKQAIIEGNSVFNIRLELNHALVAVAWENASNLPGFTISTEKAGLYLDVVPTEFRLYPETFEVTLTDNSKHLLPSNPRQTLKRYNGAIEKLFNPLEDPERNSFIMLRIPEYMPNVGDLGADDVQRVIVGMVTSPRSDIPLGTSWGLFRGKIYSLEELRTLYMNAVESSAEKAILSKIFTPQGTLQEQAKKGYQDADIQLYSNGLAYYAIPLRHFLDTEIKGRYAPGKYGTVRNHLYLLHITSFDSYGHARPEAIGYDVDYEASPFSSQIGYNRPKVIQHDIRL